MLMPIEMKRTIGRTLILNGMVFALAGCDVGATGVGGTGVGATNGATQPNPAPVAASTNNQVDVETDWVTMVAPSDSSAGVELSLNPAPGVMGKVSTRS